MKHIKCFLTAVIIASIIMIAPIGYAFHATTTVTGNTIEADYFVLGLYSDPECTTDATNILTDDVIKYSKTNGTYSVSTISIGSDSLYLRIDDTHHTGTATQLPYTVTATASCSFGTTAVENPMIDVKMGDAGTVRTNDADSSLRMDAGTFKLDLSVVNISANDLESNPTELTLSLSIKAEDRNSGICTTATSKEISASGHAIITDADSVDRALMEANEGNNFFYGDDATYTFQHAVEETNPNGDKMYSVKISALSNTSNGIGDDGDVNVRLSIPAGAKFCVRCSSNVGGNSSKLQLDITIDGNTEWVRFNYNPNFRLAYTFNNNTDYTDFHPVVYNSATNPDQIQRDLNNPAYWFQGDIVEVSIYDHQDNKNIPDSLNLEVIFWPSS